MVTGFSRSISLPLSPRRSSKNSSAASYHIRSVSLPCRSHPLISHLEEQIQAVRSWAANADGSSSWIETGLFQIETLLMAIKEFLHRSQTQEILCHAISTEGLLDDVLLLADIYGSFVSAIVTLKQHQAEVQSAIRRADKICLVSALRSQRHVEKETAQLAMCLKNVSKCRSLGFASGASEVEIAGILVEAVNATAVASVAVFSGVAAMSATTSSTKTWSTMRSFKKLACNSLTKNNVSDDDEFSIVEKLEEFEMCIRNVETCSERVFRRLINLRVSLLNISTPTL
ncbi:DUF241 domain protein (DUF241) [Rhynchospora pubera]|uniref:DUF241 domain protein (DUF241) n=1 Tax=Rhynchospora pubera TaxID=906938 RepID=A0AAV8GUV7_9POAL|nr:DUF241 domain protein (DUF241) [Rhynchospora pubera]